ncbi:uncharacterized protein LOC131166953 isoform X2 [Malania oleifera]|uniref:uncharacterized protein LOC131166953 isoform X2 n=1 Tax=Malania oleifera TaxID=397392 RepID=UPI0025AE45F0|nr:uncharacterized protein LOC131166953 isoform X2 [Malania oleifera]
MLEKIGLPAKPSLKGNNWVVDASHCQGCSSQFTFINRKHHCRRCGGLFCSSCTLHRMVLRGQGDSPVRICEPCKKLEEAARFEMRHGHKSRVGRGGSRLTPKYEDEVLNQILGEDGKQSFSLAQESAVSVSSGIPRATSGASCSNIQEVATQYNGGEVLKSLSMDEPNHAMGEMGSTSPEELRQQALDEKKKYKILKGEGKANEALKAFKRGKELERQAGALELLLRKNRRKALSSSSIAEIQKVKDVTKEPGSKNKHSPQMGKEKDELAAELRELGWSDADIHDGDKKPTSMSLEGELCTLRGEFSQKSNPDNGTHSMDKTQVIALKKRALLLKRQGKLAEAKEELKRAKILERQLEEQEFLAEAEDSDDEISSLIRSMDVDKQDDLSVGYDPVHAFDLNHLVGVGDDFSVDNFEVTDEDLDDPEMAAALKSMGWTEDSNQPEEIISESTPIDRGAVSSQIQSLKRDAVNQKRAGNAAEAMQLLKKAKILERDLDNSVSKGNSSIADNPKLVQKDSNYQTAEKPSRSDKVYDINASQKEELDPKFAPKSKLVIQRELLGLKKKALALRREGKIDEAEEELKKGKVLEQQLKEMDNVSNVRVAPANVSNDTHADISSSLINADDGEAGDVTDHDMHEPRYLTLLKNLGWQDDNEADSFSSNVSRQSDSLPVQVISSSLVQNPSSTQIGPSRRSKAEIQRELLGLKRKALVLRRQGDIEEAEEMLRMAKRLEAEVSDMEESKKEILVESHKANVTSKSPLESADDEGDGDDVTEKDMQDTSLLSMLKNLGWKDEEFDVEANSKREDKVVETVEAKPTLGCVSQNNLNSLQQEILAHKRKAVSLKREGNLADAREELRQAKLLEKSIEESNPQPSISASDVSISTSNVTAGGQTEHISSNVVLRPLSARDRFKLQQESLGHKRQALKLRREGRMDEAEAEFELAKALEAQLEESSALDATKASVNKAKPVDDVGVEDLLDPQLMSSLRAIGFQDVNTVSQGPEKSVPEKPTVESENSNQERVKSENSSQETAKLEERIKAEKLKAVNLKHLGRQAEALDALRQAKLLEKKLNSLLQQ